MLEWIGGQADELQKAFAQIFGGRLRPFGSPAIGLGGLSDDNDGVQWNAWYDLRDHRQRVGVNLEGIQYTGWPVARLIVRELADPTLPNLIEQLNDVDPIQVRWTRDYWQAASRPKIEEEAIAPTPIPLSKITPDQWSEAVKRALSCLDSSQGRWTRASQKVTLASGAKVGPVSPHLTFIFPSLSSRPWVDLLAEAKHQMQPLYDWAVERAA